MQITRYPLNSDGTPMDLLVAVVTDATGNGGARLTDPPIGPDRSPIDAKAIILINSDGTPFTIDFPEVGAISDAVFSAAWDGSLNAPTQNAAYDKLIAVDAAITAAVNNANSRIASTEKGAALGVATLDAGSKIPAAQLPAIAISSRFLVASDAAQIALAAQEGDVAIRSDTKVTYIHNGGSAGTMADWSLLETPTDVVTSVAGLVGAITAAALKTALALVKADVGLGNVDNTSDANKPVSTAQQTALNLKQNLAPNIQTPATNAASITPTFTNDQVNLTGHTVAIAFANPTGTAVDGWGIALRIKDNGVARAITWGTQYRAFGAALPSTTIAGKTMYVGIVWNALDSKWDVLSVTTEV